MITDTHHTREPLLRGGRMTKHKGQTASYAPALGWARPVLPLAALGAALAVGSAGALAGSCTDLGGGAFSCAGAAAPTPTEAPIIIRDTVNAVTLTTEPDFGRNGQIIGLTVSAENGISVTDTNASVIHGGALGMGLQSAAGMSVSVSSLLSGGDNGLSIENVAGGPAVVEVVDVQSTSGSGITAISQGSALSITSTGAIDAQKIGVSATHSGAGPMTIAVHDVTSAEKTAISVSNDGAATDLTVSASGTVTAKETGIYALNKGTGALSVTAASVTAETGSGIKAANYGTDLSVTATGAIVAGEEGVRADNAGSGALTIEVADVTSTGNHGLKAVNSVAGTDVSISVSGVLDVMDEGIYANNSGRGALTIDVTDITSEDGAGIQAKNSGTDLSITASGTIQADKGGITATNEGSGATTIAVVDVTSASGRGIRLNLDDATTDLSITASGHIQAAKTGISVDHLGTGVARIDVADVTSTGGDGFSVYLDGEAIDLSLSASGTITAAKTGVSAQNLTEGALTIDVVDVVAEAETGIFAAKSAGDGGISITASGAITSELVGVQTVNTGEGATRIAVVDVTSRSSKGVYAKNFGTDLSVTATGRVSALDNALSLENSGTGALTIVTTGALESLNGNGIRADNDGTDLSITASGPITSEETGIYTQNYGSGDLTLTAADVRSTGDSGISVINRGPGVSITTTGTIEGASDGILVKHFGAKRAEFTISGAVRGGSEAALSVLAEAGATITLLQGADLSSGRGAAIVTSDTDDDIKIHAGARVAGSIAMKGGDDALLVEGDADLTDATTISGGAGEGDALTFSGYEGGFNSATFTDWEHLTLLDGARITFENDHAVAFETLVIETGSEAVTSTPAFTVRGTAHIDEASRFSTGGGGIGSTIFERSVHNDGRISTIDGGAGDILSFFEDLGGRGVLGLDVDFAEGTHDVVFVSGDTAGASLGIDVEASGTPVDTAQTFTLVTVDGASSADDFRLVDADFVTKGGEQAVSAGEVAYVLAFDAPAGTFSLTPFEEGERLANPGGDFLAAGVAQFGQHMTFGSTLGRVLAATQEGGGEAPSVSRALHRFATDPAPSFWVEGLAEASRVSGDGRTLDTERAELRFGGAATLADTGAGRLVGGLEMGLGRLTSDVETGLTTGGIATDAMDITASALWVADTQFYADVQLRYARFDSQTTLDGGAAEDVAGRGYGMSVEIGKPFDLGRGLTLIPQAQLMYSSIDVEDAANLGGGGLTGSVQDGEQVTARLGLRAEQTMDSGAMLYAQADVYRGFDSATSVVYGSNMVATEQGGTAASLTLGGHMALSPNASFFGELTGTTQVAGASTRRSFGGRLGFEVRF